MTVLNYKNLNAKTIADAIIAREAAVAAVDFASLSLMEKCRYLYAHREHGSPSMQDKRVLLRMADEIKPELMKLADAGDCVAKFYVSLFYMGDPICHREWLDAASGDDYTVMAIYYLRGKKHEVITEEDYELARSLESYFSALQDEGQRLIGMKACHRFFALYEGKDKLECAEAMKDDRIALASLGSYSSLQALIYWSSRRAETGVTEHERIAAAEELDFWHTVSYLVMDYYVRRGNTRHCYTLARMLCEGHGCEVDVERAINCDVESLLYLKSMLSEEGLESLKRFCQLHASVDIGAYDVLYACIFGDREALHAAVTAQERSGDRSRIKKADFRIRNELYNDKIRDRS